MDVAAIIIISLIGFAGLVFAFIYEHCNITFLQKLPSPLQNRRNVFFGGLLLIFLSFVLAYWIAPYHGILGAFGGWVMLLGSAEWFNLRIERKLFAAVELKIIRNTMLIGVAIALLSTGLFYFPAHFSPGTFLLGIAIMTMPGRLWWKEDLNYEAMTMKHSKRDYS